MKVLMSLGLLTGLLLIAQPASAQRGGPKEKGPSVEAELEKLRAQVRELQRQLRGKEAKEQDRKDFGRFDPKEMGKRFAEGKGKGKFDPKEMAKRIAEGRGKFDADRAKELKKKFEDRARGGFGPRGFGGGFGRGGFGPGAFGPRGFGPGGFGPRGFGPGKEMKRDAERRPEAKRDAERRPEPKRDAERRPTQRGPQDAELNRVLERIERDLAELRRALQRR